MTTVTLQIEFDTSHTSDATIGQDLTGICAHLLARSGQPNDVTFVDASGDNTTIGDLWREYTVVLDLPEDADPGQARATLSRDLPAAITLSKINLVQVSVR